MRINLSQVPRWECSKPNCAHLGARIERHHKGCQGMWVRHFAHRRSKRYRAYKEHYEAFHEEEVTRLCQPHHWEIHQTLWIAIGRAMKKARLAPRDWSWDMAEKLIAECIALTDEWLLRQTPGTLIKPTRHVPGSLKKKSSR